MDPDGSGRRKGPAHARKHTLPRDNEARLVQLADQLPPPTEAELEITAALRTSRRRRRLLAWGAALVLVALCAGAVAQWIRPLPHATVDTAAVRLPGTPPAFAWPPSGASAAAVVGVGPVGQQRGSQSLPVAGLVDVLTAYVVLADHHLDPGQAGPALPVTADALAAYQSGLANQEAEVPLTAGETLTELDALEGLLVDSGGDMATVLADWDSGSVSAFVAKLNAAASRLGLVSTHVTDPTGVDAATTSTAQDLVRLGVASLSVPVLRQIVSLGQASVPGTTVVYNLNFDLGRDGIIGIKTASDTSAQGCYLVAAQQPVGGKNVTVVAAVLGQPAGSLGPNTTAVDAGDALVKSIFANLRSVTLYAPGQAVGEIRTPWGSSAPLTVTQPVTVIGWPGLVASVSVLHRPLDGPLPSEAAVGALRAGVGSSADSVEVRTTSALSGPGVWWRLTR